MLFRIMERIGDPHSRLLKARSHHPLLTQCSQELFLRLALIEQAFCKGPLLLSNSTFCPCFFLILLASQLSNSFTFSLCRYASALFFCTRGGLLCSHEL